jgi:hypothetical protein
MPSERVSAVLNLLKDHRKGVLDACWTELDLSPDDYDNLWAILATDPFFKGYVADKLRFVILLSFPVLILAYSDLSIGTTGLHMTLH